MPAGGLRPERSHQSTPHEALVTEFDRGVDGAAIESQDAACEQEGGVTPVARLAAEGSPLDALRARPPIGLESSDEPHAVSIAWRETGQARAPEVRREALATPLLPGLGVRRVVLSVLDALPEDAGQVAGLRAGIRQPAPCGHPPRLARRGR